MKNDGTEAQDDFISMMLETPKSYVWRMRDKKDLMGLNKGRKVAAFALPADFIVGQSGKLFYAEVKSTSDPARFNYSQLETGQRAAATVCASCSLPYWIYVYSLDRRQWFRLSAQQWNEDIRAGKKSRRFEELDFVR